jgi:hypothetical protein
MSKVHCYCNLLDATRGGMVDPDLADHIREGIPLCGSFCANRYDQAAQQREIAAQFQRSRIGGENIGRRRGAT